MTAAVLGVALSATCFAQSAVVAKDAQGFHVRPVRPIAELREEALKAAPPAEAGEFLLPELVGLERLDPSIHFEIRYAGTNNFLGQAVYDVPRALLQRPAAMALVRANGRLRELGYGLLLYDAYRPWYVTKIFWEATPPELHEFVGDPAKGSRHNRGCAVDVGLYSRKSGDPVAMPSGYDEMTPRAYSDYAGASAEEKEHRELLRRAMEAEGFTQLSNEWWHFDYKDWPKYAILNASFPPLPAAFSLNGGVLPPKLLHRTFAEFTDEARRKGINGTVTLEVTIATDGSIADVQVLRSLGYGLDESAMRAVRQWRFAPATKDGVPVSIRIRVEVNFRRG